MTEILPNQTLRSFCFADRPFALKANLRLRVSYDSKSINITAGQTASHNFTLPNLRNASMFSSPKAQTAVRHRILTICPLAPWNAMLGGR